MGKVRNKFIEFDTGDYAAKLAKLPEAMEREIIGKALYNAADIVTNEIRAGIEALPTDDRFGTPGHPLKGPTQAQKDGLSESLGITRMDSRDGVYNIKVGFDGYNATKSKRWPDGQPNQMVARSVERGTTFMKANPFIKQALRSAEAKAEEAIRKIVDAEIEKNMK